VVNTLYQFFEHIFKGINDLGVKGFTNLYLGFQTFFFIGLVGFTLFVILKEIKIMRKIKPMIEQITPGENIDKVINEIFSNIKNSRYKEQWTRYYNRSSQQKEDERIRVEPFFGFDILHYQMGYRSLMDIGAGICVSLGVLGTFIGLSVGLADLNVSDTDALRNGIDALLKGMKVAFYTSVFGVLLSLFWTLYDRVLSSQLEKQIDWHSEKLDYLLNTDDEELFLNRLEKISRNQADHLKTLLTDALEKVMQPVVTQMQSSQDHVRNAFNQLGDKFNDFHEGINNQTKLLESQLQYTQQNGNYMTERLVQQIAGGTEETISQYSSLINNTTNLQTQMLETMNQTVENFSKSEQKQAETFERTEKMLEQFSRISDELENMRGNYQETSSYMSDLGKAMNAIQKLSEQQLPVQQDVLKSNQTLAQKYDSLSEGLLNYNSHVDNQHEEMMNRLAAFSTNMSDSFGKLTEQFNVSLNTQENTLKESDELIQNVSAVAQKLVPLAPQLETIVLNIQKLEEGLIEAQRLQNDLLPVQKDVTDSNRVLAQKYSNLADSFEEFNSNLEQKQTSMLNEVMNLTNSMANSHRKMIDQYKEAINIQTASIKESDHLLSNVKDVVSKLLPVAPELTGVLKQIDGLSSEIKVMQQLQNDLLPELTQLRTETNHNIVESVSTIKSYNEKMFIQIETMKEHWDSTKQNFADTREKLDLSVKDFGENIDNGLSKTFLHLDKSLTKAVKEVSNLINQYSDIQQDLVDGLEELSESVKRNKEVVNS
jgi:methyl-accepting chemotaxis protein